MPKQKIKVTHGQGGRPYEITANHSRVKFFYDTDGKLTGLETSGKALDLTQLISLFNVSWVQAINPPITVNRVWYAFPSIPANTTAYTPEHFGKGRMLYCIFGCGADAELTRARPQILIDGQQVLPIDTLFNLYNTYYYTATGEGINLAGWHAADHIYNIAVTIPYPFQRSIRVGFVNQDGALACDALYAAFIYEKLS